MAVFMSLAMSVSLASCGDDDDDDGPEVPQKKISKVVVDYSVALSEDYYDLWDIEVSYTGAGGQAVTEKIVMDWNMQLNLNTADEIPTSYALSVTGKPKNPAPALDPDRVYKIESECLLSIGGFSSDGKQLLAAGMLLPQQHKISTDGNHLVKAVTETRPICNASYNITLE